MARFDRMTVLSAMLETGLVPVFYNGDIEVAKKIVAACDKGGARIVEFTNRGDRAWNVFTELIALQDKLPADKQRDYFALAYVGLGDSYLKNRDQGREENLAKARRAWEEGLQKYPDEAELQQRLELADRSVEELIEFVKLLRGLEDPVDTDLTRVWVE